MKTEKILIPYNFDSDLLFWLKEYYGNNDWTTNLVSVCFFPFKYDTSLI